MESSAQLEQPKRPSPSTILWAAVTYLVNAPRATVAIALILTVAAAWLPRASTVGVLLGIALGFSIFALVTRALLTRLLPQLARGDLIEGILQQLEDGRKERERYHTLIANLAAAVVIRDHTGAITYCSPYTEVLTGYPTKEICARSDDFFLSIAHEEDRERLRRALLVSAEGEAFQFRCRFLHKTGIEMWVETRTVPIADQDGSTAFSLSVMLDITGTVRYQRQVEEKNRDIQDFTYMVSHDLKAPLFTIKGMVNIIEEDFADKLTDDLRDTLSHLTKATQRLDLLVASMLEYSRVAAQEFSMEPVELSLVLADVVHDYQRQVEITQAEISVDPSMPCVLGERVRLYQLFSNLVGNALKYRSPGRTPRVEIRTVPAAKGRSEERTVQIEVQDNGLGIPAHRIEAIFRPFQRAHGEDYEGVGIGLACVKKIVERISGAISVKSQEGSGTTFTVALRRADRSSTGGA